VAGSVALGELTASRTAADSWSIGAARAEDDAAIRALLRRSVIPGAVRVAFTREPCDAAGAGVAGSTDLTIVARHREGIAGIGRCSIHAMHRNGVAQQVGYLSALRILPEASSSARMLRDGYLALADAATAAGVDGFVTAIADDNARARRVLEHGGRFGLPNYRAQASLVTLVAPVGGVRRRLRSSPMERSAAGEGAHRASREELTDFLGAHAPALQLTLPWTSAGWNALAPHGVTPETFTVVRRAGRISAAAAIWDQRAFRQTVIDGYEGALRSWRPVINALQGVRGLPALPNPGAVLPQGALFATTVPEARDWPLLWALLERRARMLSIDWLTLTLDARVPELDVLRRLTRARRYATTLYDVTWRDRPAWDDAWDGSRFAPEAGLL
jgi:hypothetical protein